MKIFGEHDTETIEELRRCAAAEPDAPAVLCADGHLGYSMPIGGVVGYREHISPSGVGYDIAVIVHGVESPQAADALYSTVHGAGRVMSRRQAKKAVDFRSVQDRVRARGTILRGADEAPEVYRKLADVLAPHAATIAIEHTLRPRIVVMAGADEHDPYKD